MRSMLSTLLREFDSLAFLQTPQLIAGMMVCETALLATNGWLAVLAFLLQRLVVVALLWPSLEPPLAAIMVLTSLAAFLLYSVAEGHLLMGKMIRRQRPPLQPALQPQAALRGLVACLGLLMTHGLVQAFPSHLLPLTVAVAVISLLVTSVLLLLLADGGLQTGLGVHTFMDASRIICALWGPNTVLWGLWAALDVLVALAASHLRRVETTALDNQAPGECQ
jgi:hypothetical protein